MSETALQNRILEAITALPGVLAWRNNTGMTMMGGRPVKFGLCVGSSDIIGIAPGGIFFALEVKTPTGKSTKAQENFIKAVRRAGGIAEIVRSVEDAIHILRSSKEIKPDAQRKKNPRLPRPR